MKIPLRTIRHEPNLVAVSPDLDASFMTQGVSSNPADMAAARIPLELSDASKILIATKMPKVANPVSNTPFIVLRTMSHRKVFSAIFLLSAVRRSCSCMAFELVDDPLKENPVRGD